LIEGFYQVGLEFNKWQISWQNHIIKNINNKLYEKFQNDKEVMHYLQKHNLLDMGYNGMIADRCYSVLVWQDDKYDVKSYSQFFKEVNEVIRLLELLQDKLLILQDTLYDCKWEWIEYIQTLIKALGETRRDKLVYYWAEVDKAWMKIKTPIQIAHPLEYYEDKYRKAVALELDIRIQNPSFKQESNTKDKIKYMFNKIYHQLNYPNQTIYDFTLKSLEQTQLFVGMAFMFFGSELNGLFSAQVVPNDENVSYQFGKKIFAYADMVLQSLKSKPLLKITTEFFSKEFIKEYTNFLANTNIWYQVYDISTIGHELGHILWCDDSSETIMNKSGNFKNIEEFKATTAGLVSFFLDTDVNKLEKEVIIDLIKRSIELIAWMENDEVRPYYVEALIHLDILYNSGMIDITTQPIKINWDKINHLKNLYIQVYKNLATIYLKKEDANVFLEQFVILEGKNFYPKNELLKQFVKRYYQRYLQIGNEIV
jgi:hypothetical protein